MTRTIRLRPWQKTALEKFVASDSADFLTVATPGAGKTTFALTAARHVLAEDPRRRLVVVAPTAHLKIQWARAAAAFALHLDPAWAAADGRLPADMHGIVTTYQQVASSAAVLAEVSRDAFVIFDEIHHAGDDRAWGESVREAFEGAARRLCISGTPFRSDTRAIPFVRYVLDEAQSDFDYGYGEALADRRVVRPVYFPRTNGHMEWTAPDGSLNAASFDDALDQARSSQRLRTALSLEGEWLPTVLRQAVDQLELLRAEQPEAGGLVIATDQDHARGIVALLRDRFGQQATVVLSDEADASARIAAFAAGRDPWLVAVRMVSEGVDIPRLRVGVYATTTTTELFFRQAVGRFVRWTPGSRTRRPTCSSPTIPACGPGRSRSPTSGATRCASASRSASSETPTRSTPGPRSSSRCSRRCRRWPPTHHQTHGTWDADDVDDDGAFDLDDDPTLLLSLAPPPPLAGDRRSLDDLGIALGGDAARTRREEKKRLREQNAELVVLLVRRTGQTHAQVNGELNRLSGIGRITEATVAQLRTRLDQAERWARRA